MSKNQYRSPQLEKKKKNLFMVRVFFWSCAFLIALYGFVFWYNHASFTVSNITVTETVFVSRTDIVDTINQIVDGRYIGVLSKRNFFFIPINEIEKEIMSTNSSIEEVSVTRTSLDRIEILVKEYAPVAKWCGINIDTENKNCHLLNTQAQLFAQETDFYKFNVPKLFGDIKQENLIGASYVSIESFTNIIQFIAQLPQLNIAVASVETEDFETFSIRTVKGPYLFIKKNDKAEEIFDNLALVINQEEINKAQFQNLQYIDLRHGNKVYYKITSASDPKN